MATAIYECPACKKNVQIIGRNRNEADRRAKWFTKEARICSDCSHAAELVARAQETAAAAAAAQAEGLPALEGTPKQIAYAEALRRRLIDAYPALLAAMLDNVRYRYVDRAEIVSDAVFNAIEAEVIDASAVVLIDIKQVTDCKFWIEDANRDAGLLPLVIARIWDRPGLIPTLANLAAGWRASGAKYPRTELYSD
jgi:hypothetical protein